MKRLLLNRCVLVWAIASHGLVSAQEQVSDSLVLSPVLVNGQQISKVYQEEVISLMEVPTATSLTSVLSSASNVYIKEYGPGNIANIALRGGTSQQTSLYWNGIPINSPSLGLTDISLMPAIFLSEVRIHSGASSLLSGTGGLAGSVELNSYPQPLGNSLLIAQSVSPALGAVESQMAVSFREGAMDARTAIYSTVVENEFKYVDDSGAKDVERIREHAAIEGHGLAQDLRYSFNSTSQLEAHATYLKMDRQLPANIGSTPRYETQDDEVIRIALQFLTVRKSWRHSATLGYSGEQQVFNAPLALIESNIRTSQYHARYQVSYAVNSHTMIRSRVDHNRSEALVDANGRNQRDETGWFTELEQEISDHSLVNGGVRLQLVDGVWRPYTASVGLVHELSGMHGLKVRASGSKNYRIPTLNDLYWPELGNDDLDPEDGYSLDVGMDYSYKKISASVTGYLNQMSGLITWLPGTDGRYSPINVSRSKGLGVESRCEVRLSKVLSCSGAYTYTDGEARVQEGDAWQQKVYQPTHQGVFRTEAELGASRFGFRYNYMSGVRTDYTAFALRSKLSAIHLLDLGYWWSPADVPSVTLGFEIKNLLDKNYEYIKDRPIPGAYVQFQLNIKLNEN